jgi:sRNA-binding carbon storage regulator CsrA
LFSRAVATKKIVFPTLGISIGIRRITGNKVPLAIAAPISIPVYRQELLEHHASEEKNHGCPRLPR